MEECVESLNFSIILEGDCKMKYIFKPLIVAVVSCTGLFFSGYSYADGGSNYNHVNRYQKYEQHNDHHCDKRDCDLCRKYNRNSSQKKQNYFSLRNNRPYFYFSFGGNDDRFRYGSGNNGYYRDDSHNCRNGHNRHKHHGRKHCKHC